MGIVTTILTQNELFNLHWCIEQGLFQTFRVYLVSLIIQRKGSLPYKDWAPSGYHQRWMNLGAWLSFAFSSDSTKIGCLLFKYGIKTIYHSPGGIHQVLLLVKDYLDWRTQSIYRSPCECGLCYIGQTCHTRADHFKEYLHCIGLNYPDKPVLAQHSIETRH